MIPGKLILYDKFGSEHDVLSPSKFTYDYGLAVVLSEDGKTCTILCDDGHQRIFSQSYLKSVEQFSSRP